MRAGKSNKYVFDMAISEKLFFGTDWRLFSLHGDLRTRVDTPQERFRGRVGFEEARGRGFLTKCHEQRAATAHFTIQTTMRSTRVFFFLNVGDARRDDPIRTLRNV